MSVATKLESSICELRAVLGPGGNRVRVSEPPKHKKIPPLSTPRVLRIHIQLARLPRRRRVLERLLGPSELPSLSQTTSLNRTVHLNDVNGLHQTPSRNICFHDEEWGVPVYDDEKLFELLFLSQALAELSWPDILTKRKKFRKLFDNFDPSSIANFDEPKLLSLKIHGIPILSQQKLRAIVDNAIQVVKIQQEFGSFSKYCWNFVNQKVINNGVRYGRQVPAKSPKAETISKYLMRRGFCCVGPTVVYSFMQVAGIVNDHLVTCFRHKKCDATVKMDLKHEENEKSDVILK